jgi:uncharacterized protein YndB with AHSA1/START domain
VRIEASATIERPIAAVWEYLADPANNPKWDPGTLEVRQTSEGPIGVGTTLDVVVDLLGRQSLGVRITAFEPERELRFEFVSGFMKPTRVAYRLAAVDPRRTRLTRVFEPELSGRWRLLWPVLVWMARRHRADEVSNVKRILEATSSNLQPGVPALVEQHAFVSSSIADPHCAGPGG